MIRMLCFMFALTLLGLTVAPTAYAACMHDDGMAMEMSCHDMDQAQDDGGCDCCDGACQCDNGLLSHVVLPDVQRLPLHETASYVATASPVFTSVIHTLPTAPPNSDA